VPTWGTTCHEGSGTPIGAGSKLPLLDSAPT